jgi:hypothetical protein
MKTTYAKGDTLYVVNVLAEGLLDLLPADSDRETWDGQTYYFPPAQVDEDEPVYICRGDNDCGVSALVYAPDEIEADARLVRAFGLDVDFDDGPQPNVEQYPPGVLLHKCDDHATYVETDGALGHGWECGLCGRFLQAG